MPIAFPRVVREYLVKMASHKGVFWQRDRVVGVIVKLPKNVPILSMDVSFGTFHRDASLTLHIPLHLQARNPPLTIDVDCLVNPPSLSSMSVVTALLSTEQVEVYFISPDRTYLGIHQLPWSLKKRRLLAALVHGPALLQEPEIPLVKQEGSFLPIARQEQEKRSLSLLDQYLMTLHELHEQEEEALRQQHTPSLAQTLLPLMHSIYTREEKVLARAQPLAITERHIQKLSQLRASAPLPFHIEFPNYPFWCEWFHPPSGYWRQHIGLFGFRGTQAPHSLYQSTGGQWSYRSFDSTARWLLDVVDESGSPFLRLLTKNFSPTGETVWGVDPSHLCPTRTCLQAASSTLGRATVQLCDACLREAQFWSQWSNTLLALALNQPFTKSRPEAAVPHDEPVSQLQQEASEEGTVVTAAPSSRTEAPLIEEVQKQLTSVSTPLKEQKPVIVPHPLLIDRYTQRQRTTEMQEAIEHASKFLWMHSAWFMTEALCYTIDEDEFLHLPSSHLYIELEQTHQLNNQPFAACSFLCLSGLGQSVQRWQYSVIDIHGQSIWHIFYEGDTVKGQGHWTLPKEYLCPDGQCHVEETASGRRFTLCEACQRVLASYVSWIVIALRMIAGDFQEQVELREPEEVLETSKKVEKDQGSGQEREKTVLHRYRVIRYYDASLKHDGTPRSRRGSWMTGKPLASSEYEINPNAIIFVKIQPREHDRTYRHDRYTYMKGKKQHIDPPPRLQPMTIATFRQLPRMQRITKVYASTFNEQEDESH